MSYLYRLTFRLPVTALSLSLLPAAPHQCGAWVDRRSARCTVVGLGRALLYVEQDAAAPFLRFCP